MNSDFDKLVSRLDRAYSCFLIWKYLKISISIPDSGKEEAERRVGIMNNYVGVFSTVIYAVESTFITDLHKFFDKSKGSLNLETLINNLSTEDQREARSLIKSVEKEIKRIKILRHNFTAHESKTPKEEKIFSLECEKVFSAVQELINLISKSVCKEFLVWDLLENKINQSLSCLLDDLELGYEARMPKIN